ncbi:MAG: tRNA (adenosine(37)-N6)-threonylcarbamoyltransferase complex ATPase subunit type 1 TsaE [Gammaproteobacteria bacterium]
MKHKSENLIIKSAPAMRSLGAKLAHAWQANGDCVPLVIYLQGNLGSGKTTLTRGFLHALGYKEKIKSPTFTIVESYDLNGKNVYHFDLYRLKDPSELEYIGIRDYLHNGVLLIEWPECAPDNIPAADLICSIKYDLKKPRERNITLCAKSSSGTKILNTLDQKIHLKKSGSS